ncbi:MAG: hypothetical protein R6U04_05515, partial [Bacteroidales bacterium]
SQESAADITLRLRRQLQRVGEDQAFAQPVQVNYDAVGGIKISVPNIILFEAGSTTISPEAYPLLHAIAEVLQDLPAAFRGTPVYISCLKLFYCCIMQFDHESKHR